MIWRDVEIPKDDSGEPMFTLCRVLTNDKGERLGSICAFFENGPFYTHVMDPDDTTQIRRIGPISTLANAEKRVEEILVGAGILPRGTASYPRR